MQAQSYKPDTSLSYSAFLQQCVGFSKRTNVQEVWVITFWASWNSNSLTTMPVLKGLSKKYANKPVRFINLSTDKNREDWERALRRYEMPWEQVIVQRENDYSFLKRAFKHNALPALFLVTNDGKINHVKDTQDLDVVLGTSTAALPNHPYLKPSAGTFPPKPTPAGETRPTGNEQWLLHTVKSGETLFGLARQYGVTVDGIKSANNLTDNSILVGSALKIKRM